MKISNLTSDQMEAYLANGRRERAKAFGEFFSRLWSGKPTPDQDHSLERYQQQSATS